MFDSSAESTNEEPGKKKKKKRKRKRKMIDRSAVCSLRWTVHGNWPQQSVTLYLSVLA
jgi:hypothetical protein